ncbi:hypothetical protein [Paenibacillus crassostreae]|uniref:Uncharacterized protein n=1 Tax=Paenibacillus crassostreae TaxID=1763538 RepID=A0A167DPX2_9BACL|nr:hypothetical protein [Paenibacillus crassostreae]AOZ91200.1 hypothetical protein LPB68_02565 [Paenibacillus crassostreae]OAB74642.1 hypothetical protein PNBC_11395 [Paenibacillus crassostreae]
MRRLFLLGVIIVIVSLTGCTSLQDNNNGSELNTTKFLPTSTKLTNEDFIETPPIEKEHSDEVIVKEVPRQLKGSIEDDALRASILAELDTDKLNYKTNIVFSNKTGIS